MGINTTNLSNYGLTYRLGDQNAMWRFNLLGINLNSTNTTKNDSVEGSKNELSFGFNAGREWRNALGPNFELRYGVDLSFRYWREESQPVDAYSYEIVDGYSTGFGVNFVIGGNFIASERILIGFEFLPNMYYQTEEIEYENGDKNSSKGLIFGATSSNILLSVVYKF
jgi:hypothetical protein